MNNVNWDKAKNFNKLNKNRYLWNYFYQLDFLYNRYYYFI